MKIWKQIVISIAVPLVVALLILLTQQFFDTKLEINDTVLMFVGILATFIVVGNYAQVVKIKDEMQEELQRVTTERTDKFFEKSLKTKITGTESIAQSYYIMAMSTNDLFTKLKFFEKASSSCLDSEKELKAKTDEFISTIKQLIKEKEFAEPNMWTIGS